MGAIAEAADRRILGARPPERAPIGGALASLGLHLAALLQRAAHSPFYPELESSLPILGMDGTVKRRFRDSSLAGHAHLKTGTLDGVKAVAGYVDAADGRKWIVTFIINGPNASRGRAAQDALIAWVGRNSK